MAQFLILTTQEATDIETLTAQWRHRLAPREVAAGEHAGSFVLPARILTEENYSQYGEQYPGAWAGFPTAEIDPAEAWPVEGES